MSDFRNQRGGYKFYPQKEWIWDFKTLKMVFVDRKMYESSCMVCLRPGNRSLTNLGSEKDPFWCCDSCLKDARKRL